MKLKLRLKRLILFKMYSSTHTVIFFNTMLF